MAKAVHLGPYSKCDIISVMKVGIGVNGELKHCVMISYFFMYFMYMYFILRIFSQSLILSTLCNDIILLFHVFRITDFLPKSNFINIV